MSPFHHRSGLDFNLHCHKNTYNPEAIIDWNVFGLLHFIFTTALCVLCSGNLSCYGIYSHLSFLSQKKFCQCKCQLGLPVLRAGTHPVMLRAVAAINPEKETYFMLVQRTRDICPWTHLCNISCYGKMLCSVTQFYGLEVELQQALCYVK